MLQPKKRRNVRVDDQSDDKAPGAPIPAPFKDFATMFKVSHVDSTVVECVSCATMYPLSDLLAGALEEEACPHCQVTAVEHYTNRPHQALPPQSDYL